MIEKTAERSRSGRGPAERSSFAVLAADGICNRGVNGYGAGQSVSSYKEASSMADTPPDHLSSNPSSPHYNEALLERGIGIRFNGVEKTNVEEYCVSEGWIRVSAGTAKDRAGNPMTIKLKGKVEPYFRDNR
jgi:hypothetical protein